MLFLYPLIVLAFLLLEGVLSSTSVNLKYPRREPGKSTDKIMTSSVLLFFRGRCQAQLQVVVSERNK